MDLIRRRTDCQSFKAIAKILSDRADQLLTRMDILDIVNWLGTILSSRRSAQIALFEYGQPEWEEFAIGEERVVAERQCPPTTIQ